jgi:hypothetical protein
MTEPTETPANRSLRARVAALSRWAYADGREGTEPARSAFLRTFETKVDPDHRLSEDERRRRAERALRLHMTRLALASAKARARRSGGDRRG